MALDYAETAKKILDGVGGAKNVVSATNCMTRLRLVLNDESKADDDKVGKIKGVKSVIKQGGQYQVVIGNEVSDVMKEFDKLGNFSGKAAPPQKQTGNPISRLFGFVAGCMTPLLPAMLGCGMMKVVLVLCTTFFGMSTESSTYLFLNAMGDAFFTFLPVFLAVTIAQKQGGTVVLYMLVAAVMVYPDVVSLMAGGSMELGTFLGMPCTYLFGLPVICTTYTSSVLPILLMAPVMKYVEKFADWVSPNVLKAFLKPLIFLVICVPVALYVLGPIGGVVGEGLATGLNMLYDTVPWLTVFIVSALCPFIVMTGMHYALSPIAINNLALLGFDGLVIIAMFCSNLAQGGAALGIALKTKNEDTKSEGLASSISAMVAGVTEPAMYGINMRFITGMVSAVIAAGISGLVAGVTRLVCYTMGGSPSLLSIITFIGGDSPMRGVFLGILCALLSLVISFLLSFILYKDPVEAEEDEGDDTEEIAEDAEPEAKPLAEKVTLSSPLTGKVVKLSDVPDEVFSSGTMGDGVAILPTEGVVVAPCDCEVSATMDTKHAIGLTTPEGMELLIHVGLDTVKLNGQYYEYKVAEGDQVKRGDVLITFDMKGIESAGYQLHTPVLVTNSDDYASVLPAEADSVKAGETLITVE